MSDEPRRCARCRHVIVLLRDEPPRELCWCCERQIPLPGAHVFDGKPEEPCTS